LRTPLLPQGFPYEDLEFSPSSTTIGRSGPASRKSSTVRQVHDQIVAIAGRLRERSSRFWPRALPQRSRRTYNRFPGAKLPPSGTNNSNPRHHLPNSHPQNLNPHPLTSATQPSTITSTWHRPDHRGGHLRHPRRGGGCRHGPRDGFNRRDAVRCGSSRPAPIAGKKETLFSANVLIVVAGYEGSAASVSEVWSATGHRGGHKCRLWRQLRGPAPCSPC